jgi:hypothetical protein
MTIVIALWAWSGKVDTGFPKKIMPKQKDRAG